MINRFRPQDLPKSYVMKQRLKEGHSDNYNWQSRIEWFPVGCGLNKRRLSKQFQRLHYLACHAPEPIQKQWEKAYNLFMKKHFAIAGKASMRFLNNHTCHSWL
jgi:hypothetical protein